MMFLRRVCSVQAFRVCALLVLVGSGIMICGGCSGGKSAETGPTAFDAWVACQLFVKEDLVAPATADFPWWGEVEVVQLNATDFEVRSYVDSENLMGAKVRTFFTCKVRYTEESWLLLELEFE